ncbi:MAG: tetratricopeptide repeat protein [Planctomycetota bacterium]|nr:tetratricopeptide repeat protein [Planctomycetota bacterium]
MAKRSSSRPPVDRSSARETSSGPSRFRLAPSPTSLLAILLAAGVILLAFSPVLRAGFFEVDDPIYVVRNPNLTLGLTPAGIGWAFTTTGAANYHPLTWVSLLVDHRLFGLDPAGYHLTNLLLHVANAGLVFLLFRRLGLAGWRSALAAGLFALHPLRVESVAWVSERKDVLSACLGLMALLAYVEYARRPSPVRYLASALLLTLGLLAKPMLVTFPVLFLLLDAWPLRRFRPAGEADGGTSGPAFPPASARWLVVEKLPLLGIVTIFSAATLVAQHAGGAVRSLGQQGLAGRFANVPIAYVRYLGKTLWPRDLIVFYPFPLGGWAAWQVAASATVLVAVTFLAWRIRRTSPWLLVGWLWFLVALTPVIGIVQVATQSLADRYTYLPSLGLILMAVGSLPDRYVRTARDRAILAFTAGVVLASLAVLTFARAREWHDSRTLLTQAVRVSPENTMAIYFLGVVLQDAGENGLAWDHYQRVLDLIPDDSPRAWEWNALAHHRLGVILQATGREGGATYQYFRALEVDPDLQDARYNSAIILQRHGQLGPAREAYERVLRAAPERTDAHNNLGLVLQATGDWAGAERHFREALRIAPQNRAAVVNLEALVAARKAPQTAPASQRGE